MEKREYTNEELWVALGKTLDTNIKLTNALGVALEFAPDHVKQRIADELGGGGV